MRSFLSIALLLAATGLVSADLSAADPAPATKESLKASFATRDAAITAAKAAGTLGETIAGILAVPAGVTADAATTALLTTENADRLQLYKLLAAETGAEPAQVAQRNAMRNYQSAAAGTWLQKRDGTWAKK